jgi:hypothetical protein
VEFIVTFAGKMKVVLRSLFEISGNLIALDVCKHESVTLEPGEPNSCPHSDFGLYIHVCLLVFIFVNTCNSTLFS